MVQYRQLSECLFLTLKLVYIQEVTVVTKCTASRTQFRGSTAVEAIRDPSDGEGAELEPMQSRKLEYLLLRLALRPQYTTWPAAVSISFSRAPAHDVGRSM